MTRGGVGFFRVVILPGLTVWALGGLSNGTVLPMSSNYDIYVSRNYDNM